MIMTEYRKNTHFEKWALWFFKDFLKILAIWTSFSYKLFSYKNMY